MIMLSWILGHCHDSGHLVLLIYICEHVVSNFRNCSNCIFSDLDADIWSLAYDEHAQLVYYMDEKTAVLHKSSLLGGKPGVVLDDQVIPNVMALDKSTGCVDNYICKDIYISSLNRVLQIYKIILLHCW